MSSSNQNPDLLLTSKEVCNALRITKKTLENWRRAGKIEYYKFGHRSVRFPQSELDRFLGSKARPAQPACPACGHPTYCLSCDHTGKAIA